MLGKALFILFAIVLPLGVFVAISALAFVVYGGQGACFIPPLAVVYCGVALVWFEAQRHRAMRAGERVEDEHNAD
ncbi:MAG: hypothetical protein ACTS27_01885 [Phycisphaerales bacterium]